MQSIVLNPANLMLLKVGVIKKNRELTDNIVDNIEIQCDDLSRQLQHDVEWCGDPKAFYEKEIRYRLESMERHDTRHIINMITQGEANVLYWVQNQLSNMGVKRFSLPFKNYTFTSDDFTPNKLELVNLRQGRLLTKMGMVVTALLGKEFTLGVFIASMVCGTIGEEILHMRTLQSRRRIQEKIPAIVNNYRDQMKMKVLHTMSATQSQIVESLNQLHYEPYKLQ